MCLCSGLNGLFPAGRLSPKRFFGLVQSWSVESTSILNKSHYVISGNLFWRYESFQWEPNAQRQYKLFQKISIPEASWLSRQKDPLHFCRFERRWCFSYWSSKKGFAFERSVTSYRFKKCKSETQQVKPNITIGQNEWLRSGFTWCSRFITYHIFY